MRNRGSLNIGLGEQKQLDEDSESGLLNHQGGSEDGEGAGLLPMDPEKTLAMVNCNFSSTAEHYSDLSRRANC
jgi:hypothetical protein